MYFCSTFKTKIYTKIKQNKLIPSLHWITRSSDHSSRNHPFPNSCSQKNNNKSKHFITVMANSEDKTRFFLKIWSINTLYKRAQIWSTVDLWESWVNLSDLLPLAVDKHITNMAKQAWPCKPSSSLGGALGRNTTMGRFF